jgi:hypothetical protein
MKAVSGSIKKQPAPASPRSPAAQVVLVRTRPSNLSIYCSDGTLFPGFKSSIHTR